MTSGVLKYTMRFEKLAPQGSRSRSSISSRELAILLAALICAKASAAVDQVVLVADVPLGRGPPLHA